MSWPETTLRAIGGRMSAALAALLFAVVLAMALVPATAAAIDQNDRCLECHGSDAQGTVDVNGEQKSLAVDEAAWHTSTHSLLDCTGCHLGFKPHAHTPDETEGWYQTARLLACGTCHADQFSMYEDSFHGNLVLGESDGEAPACADCHGSHAIQPAESAAFRVQVAARCEACHGVRSETYLDTYHGKAFTLGRADAATCPDCHGSHKILPASDPESTVSEQNLVATCGACHPGANDQFVKYLVHVKASDPHSSLVVFSVYLGYVLLIATVFTFGGVHTVMYIYRGRKEGMYRSDND
jgi:hypothetical protein